MLPLSASVTLLVLFTSHLQTSRSVPLTSIPTTPLPPLPTRRYLDPKFEKDLFKDGYSVDYADPKRALAQNAKNYPINWGPPPNDWAENYYNPSPPPNPFPNPRDPFPEQDQRGMIESNNVQQTYFEGYYPDDDLNGEDDDSYADSSDYGVDAQTLSYQSNGQYAMYLNNESSNDNDGSDTEDDDNDLGYDDDDSDYDTMSNTITIGVLPSPLSQERPTIPQEWPTLQQEWMFGPKMPQPKLGFNPDYDNIENDLKMRSREMRPPNKPPLRGNYLPPLQTLPLQVPVLPDSKLKVPKEVKPVIEESAAVIEKIPIAEKTTVAEKSPSVEKPTTTEKSLAAEKVSVEWEVFSRTTTVTKTTIWYVSDNNVLMKEEIDEDVKPSPIKGKYIKTSKTTTSGPVPWYLQEFEDVIFEEENERSKTILDKMSQLKGMNPTSITSYTTAPNPWSSEVHEDVVLEEQFTINKKENKNESDKSTRQISSHASPLDHIVEYLPRTQTQAIKEVEMVEAIVEEIIDILEENNDEKAFLNPNQYHHFQFNQPPVDLEPPIVEEDLNFVENPYLTEYHNGMNPNQITTQKPTLTLQPADNFTPYPSIGPIQPPEQMYPQPNYNMPLPPTPIPQMYANMPGSASRRELQQQQQEKMMQDEQGRIQQRIEENRQKMGAQGKRPMYPNRQQMMNRATPNPRDL